MLRSLKDLERYTVSATDGDIGSVANFLLDDQHWTVRYLVAETDGFFDGRRVLISPISLRQADWPTRRLHVALTRYKVKKSPSIDVDKPVSRQHERQEGSGCSPLGKPHQLGGTQGPRRPVPKCDQEQPEWNASAAVNREYEARLYDYYGRPVYWGSGDQPAATPSVNQSASHPG